MGKVSMKNIMNKLALLYPVKKKKGFQIDSWMSFFLFFTVLFQFFLFAFVPFYFSVLFISECEPLYLGSYRNFMEDVFPFMKRIK